MSSLPDIVQLNAQAAGVYFGDPAHRFQPDQVAAVVLDPAALFFAYGRPISGEPVIGILRRLTGVPLYPVLDAAYLFAASMGIYVRAGDSIQLQEAA